MEVESGFQLEDFFVLVKRLLPSLKYLSWSLEQLENLIDWWRDMEPLLKLGVPKLIDYLDGLEQKGIFPHQRRGAGDVWQNRHPL